MHPLDASASLREILEKIRLTYWAPFGPALRRASWITPLTAVLAAALLARLGTWGARSGAACLVVGTLLVFGVLYWRRARQKMHLERVLHELVPLGDNAVAARVLRSWRVLVEASASGMYGSRSLAASYFQSNLARISFPEIERSARRRALLVNAWVFIALAAVFWFGFARPREVVEGLNVAFAKAGRAPMQMVWMDTLEVTAAPPPYLRQAQEFLEWDSQGNEYIGTLLTFHGVPIDSKAEIVLTNGEREVPFVRSENGTWTARWMLEKSERLTVAVRFGSVLVEQPGALTMNALNDRVPTVELDGYGGKEITLLPGQSLEVTYRASDDHGLRQVDLVFRSNQREERRTLMRLDGEQMNQVGMFALSPEDKFLREPQVPVQVRVEARDDNDLRRDNWGGSLWLTLNPEVPGRFEAERHDGLVRLRSELIMWLSVKLTQLQGRAGVPDADRSHASAALERLNAALALSHGGRWPLPMFALMGTLQDELQRSTRQSTSQESLEESVLLVDALVAEMSDRDAVATARRIADLAEDAASGARQALRVEFRDASIRQLDADLVLLNQSQRPLSMLGELGADLGQVLKATLSRVARARQNDDYVHVQLALEHLAQRFRHPEPSAGAGAGAESAGDPSKAARPKMSVPDSVRRTERALEAWEQLRRDHRLAVGKLESTLRKTSSDSGADQGDDAALRELGKRESDLVEQARALNALEQRGQPVVPGRLRRELAQATSLMDSASRELNASQGQAALEFEQQAQALLDQFGEGSDGGQRAGGTSEGETQKGFVTPDGDRQAAQRFRERVQRGLSRHSPSDLEPIVRRYAEGLLR